MKQAEIDSRFHYLGFEEVKGHFPLFDGKDSVVILVDNLDHPGVLRAVRDLRSDFAKVTGATPEVARNFMPDKGRLLIVGSLDKSPLLNRLAKEGKINVDQIRGKWESFITVTVDSPLPGVESALVICGSDKRGTVYGVYELCEQMGVSAWHWWGDVPAKKHDKLYVRPGEYLWGEPAVKYRGIFLNDEWPGLTCWVNRKFGDYGHQFYEHVFELILRLKGNYLWPAMWNNAFGDDDPLNFIAANQYGIVLGNSHHEPMLRAQKEWTRYNNGGHWDYRYNADYIKEFWAKSIRERKDFESIITLAMRGDGDEPMMGQGSELLLKIVQDQREIIAKETGKDPTKVPQLWALYKEVAEFYEKGMRVPDDVTILWSDDNWGNLRRVPDEAERKRSGGNGIYYHVDYVGGPRSYKWLNTVPVNKMREQMNLALEYGANRVWILNVGDLKPVEFPLEYFLRLAYDPTRLPMREVENFGIEWAARNFPVEHASDIAEIIAVYTKFNGLRKPELLEPGTFSVVNYNEADSLVTRFEAVVAKAEGIYAKIAKEYKDAFFQLVLYPAKASYQVFAMYVATAKNRLYAAQGRVTAKDWADKARALFATDAELTRHYNDELSGGKWKHMMDQTHIGYTYWNHPDVNAIPELAEVKPAPGADPAISVEASPDAWPGAQGSPALLEFDVFNRQIRSIDLFNRGLTPFEYFMSASEPWIRIEGAKGKVEKESRIMVSVDWAKAPVNRASATINIETSVAGKAMRGFSLRLSAFNPAEPNHASFDGFIEAEGCLSIEAAHYSRAKNSGDTRWEELENYGRTLSSMTVFPVTAASVLPPASAPCLEYDFYLFSPGKFQVSSIIAPSLDFVRGRSLRYAVSFDNGAPQVIEAVPQAPNGANAGDGLMVWEESVKDNARIIKSDHEIQAAGKHTLKFWMVDPGLVLQKLVLDFGGLRPSYLGPTESYKGPVKA